MPILSSDLAPGSLKLISTSREADAPSEGVSLGWGHRPRCGTTVHGVVPHARRWQRNSSRAPGKQGRAAPLLVVWATGCFTSPPLWGLTHPALLNQNLGSGGPRGGPRRGSSRRANTRRSRPGQPRHAGARHLQVLCSSALQRSRHTEPPGSVPLGRDAVCKLLGKLVAGPDPAPWGAAPLAPEGSSGSSQAGCHQIQVLMPGPQSGPAGRAVKTEPCAGGRAPGEPAPVAPHSLRVAASLKCGGGGPCSPQCEGGPPPP